MIAAHRPPGGHHAFREQRHSLMYLGANGALVTLTRNDARQLIRQHGSVRKAAKAIGLPKSTLHDLARAVGKKH